MPVIPRALAVASALFALASDARAQGTVTVVDLNNTGKTLLILPDAGPGWTALDNNGQDIVAHPDAPQTVMRLLPMTAEDCGKALEKAADSMAGRLRAVKAPPYLPPSYAPATLESDVDSSHVAGTCVELETGGQLVVLVVTDAALTGAFATGPLKGMLFSLGIAFGAKDAVAAAPPAAPPPPPPPADTSALGALTQATGSGTTSGAAPPKVVTPAPAPPPPYVPDDDDDFDLEAGTREPSVVGLDLRFGYMAPDGFDDVVGAVAQLQGAPFLTEELDDWFAACLGYGVSLGVNSDGNVPFDFHLGLGPGLRLGPVTVAALAGLGADTMGAADGGYDMDAAFYWYPQGRLRIGLGPVGIEGVAARTFRGSIGGEIADDIPNQTRVDARVYGRIIEDYEPFVGFHWTDMSREDLETGVDTDAHYLGGMIGAAIPRED